METPQENVRHVAVAGNIGSGKTTLASKLAKHYNWQIEYEAVDNNPYLKDFYDDMARWSFHLQIYFLNSRFDQVKKIRQSDRPVIQDRTIYEDAHIFAKNLHKSGLMNDRDYHNYISLFNSMIPFVGAPDLLIYLRSDIPKLVYQIEKRGRDYENTIRIDYLKNLNQHYEEWISNYDKGNLLIIDVNNLDFVANTDDFAEIIQKVDREINGLFSKPFGKK